jgi:transcriptional regulator of acetoin/glycerol metabolism
MSNPVPCRGQGARHALHMSSEALILREVGDAMWRDFASGALGERLDQLPVLEHWRRALALGAPLEGPPREEHLVRGEALREHLERTELIQHVAATELERATSDVSRRQYVLLLADPSGVVVSSSGGGRFSEEARRVRLIPGARWNEVSRGTNAIGTAILTRRPVFVRGNAHFSHPYHELVCYAAPIFDVDGSLAAVLDATSSFACADDAVGQAVIRAASAITEALRDHAFARAGAGLRQTLARSLDRMDGIALLVEPPARVTRMNTGARALFKGRAGASASELLGFDMQRLVAESHEPRGLRLELDGRAYAARVDPIETAEGGVLALLVFLEPLAAPQSHLLGPAPSVRPALAPVEHEAFAGVFSLDPRLDQALSLARRVADSALPVMLLAETGSGKELVARAIHAASGRAHGEFVAVNCGAIAPTLLESELFGYGPAAFTGAEREGKKGLFASASGGTLFLDEVAEMPLAMQAALLRVLEDGTYRRVGETAARHADVRIVCATCKDLRQRVVAGAFRVDLYYRLKGAEVSLPPLRARSDRAALAVFLLGQLARARQVEPVPRLSPTVLALIDRHRWPGNVRELSTLLELSLILGAGSPSIGIEHLPAEFLDEVEGSALPAEVSAGSDLAAAERETVRRALREVDGNLSLAARRLGVARSTLYRMLRRHGL